MKMEDMNNLNEMEKSNTNKVEEKPKTGKTSLIVCGILIAILVAISAFYLIESLSFVNLEALALIVTLPVILGSNILATIISIINFVLALKKTKAQKITALVIMIVTIVYSVVSIAVLYIR